SPVSRLAAACPALAAAFLAACSARLAASVALSLGLVGSSASATAPRATRQTSSQVCRRLPPSPFMDTLTATLPAFWQTCQSSSMVRTLSSSSHAGCELLPSSSRMLLYAPESPFCRRHPMVQVVPPGGSKGT